MTPVFVLVSSVCNPDDDPNCFRLYANHWEKTKRNNKGFRSEKERTLTALSIF